MENWDANGIEEKTVAGICAFYGGYANYDICVTNGLCEPDAEGKVELSGVSVHSKQDHGGRDGGSGRRPGGDWTGRSACGEGLRGGG